MKSDIWHVKNICVAKSERVMKICPPHEDVQVSLCITIEVYMEIELSVSSLTWDGIWEH